jgi:mevalonate kinase
MTKSYFIFIANDILLSPKKKLSADEIANTLLSQGFWAFSEQAPLRKKLFEQDELLIYLAGHKRRHFVATAQVAKKSDKITENEQKILKKLGLSYMQYRVLLNNVQRHSYLS